jgi:hypothetical protein
MFGLFGLTGDEQGTASVLSNLGVVELHAGHR